MIRTTARLLHTAAPAGLPLARSAVALGLGKVFGPPPFDPRRDPGDPGLFGPDSGSWRVIGDPASIVGGIRALLVQLLHPLAMAGVTDHSRFRTDALGRLHGTSAWVTTTTFGSTAEALAAARRVRGQHRPVAGTAPDGRPYRAGDPHLLAWVSIALTSSFLVADRQYAAVPVPGRTADAFVAEQARAAALLDPRVDLDALAGDEAALAALRAGTLALPMLDEGGLPTTVAELESAVAAFADELAVGPQARRALSFLLWPSVPAPMRAGYLPLLAGAVASLEPAQRRLMGLPAARVAYVPARLQATALLAGLRLVTGGSPSARWAAQRVAGGG